MNSFRVRLRVRCKPRKKKTWYIRIQKRAAYNGRFRVDDCRAYREFSAWPLGFESYKLAQAHMDACFSFRNLSGRKMSASVTQSVQV